MTVLMHAVSCRLSALVFGAQAIQRLGIFYLLFFCLVEKGDGRRFDLFADALFAAGGGATKYVN